MQEHRTFCRICAAACGVVVSIEGDQIVRVRGDADHPVSRGYTCSKGRALGDWHHRADRLDRPRLHGAEVGWDTVLDDLGAALSRLVADPALGRDAIALYLATGFAYDSAGQVAAAMWMGAVGSSSFFTAATVDNAPVLVAAELVAGHPMLNPVWDPSFPGVLVLVGSNPVVSHGYGTTLPDPVRYLRDYRRAGGRIWVLDPRRTESAALADHHLALRPGADVEVLAWLAHELLSSSPSAHCAPDDLERLTVALAPFSLARAAEAAGVPEPALAALLDDVRGAPGRVAMFCGTGVTMAPDGILAEWLRWVVLALTD
jgi:anaerobic selenocysteine-containing dehydrogenase